MDKAPTTMMHSFMCPQCQADLYFDGSRRMLYSDICKHKLCNVCANRLIGVSDKCRGSCPECKQPLLRSSYVSRDPDEDQAELTAATRRRLLKIYNSERKRFDSTPSYNDYLERREDIIQALVSSVTSDDRKKKLEEETRQYRKANQVEIVENESLKNSSFEEQVRSVVRQEGTTFEKVKLPLSAKHLQHHIKLIHPLEIAFKELFDKQKDDNGSAPTFGIPRPLDVSIKEDSDLPRKPFRTYAEFRAAEIAGGYNMDVIKSRQLSELLYGFVD
eukprot:GHVS01057325.1.p1 GENE.GHVS01057325.1~~GHVS01057325.1.p1  ORF type:complete len:274 (+),score=39.46 GHVS01057325.1:238-1059(+)